MTRSAQLAVLDRNGNPKGLRSKPFSVPVANEGGDVQMRDGSLIDPIVLKALQELLNGQGVIVSNGQGVIGRAVPAGPDRYLSFTGGAVQWIDVIPRTNTFRETEIVAQQGRLVTIGCAIDGQLTLGYLSVENGDYLSVVNGQAVAKNFCDADEVESGNGVFVCKDGRLAQLTGVEGDTIIVNSDNEAEFVPASIGINLLNAHHVIASQYIGNMLSGIEVWSNVGSPAGVFDVTVAGVPETAKLAWVMAKCQSDVQVESGAYQANASVKANGLLINETYMHSHGFGYINHTPTWVKITNKTFSYELSTLITNPAVNGAGAMIQIHGWA